MVLFLDNWHYKEARVLIAVRMQVWILYNTTPLYTFVSRQYTINKYLGSQKILTQNAKYNIITQKTADISGHLLKAQIYRV